MSQARDRINSGAPGCSGLTCQEFIELILDFLEGDIPPTVRALCEQHLKACRACVDYLASYQTATELGRRAHKIDDGGEVGLPDELLQAILKSAGQTGG
jgi:anti-sigma factor RsiW